MKHLAALNKYFWKYKWTFLIGIVFIILSNYFRILSPQVTKYVLNTVEQSLQKDKPAYANTTANYDPLVKSLFIQNLSASSLKNKIFVCGIILLVLALISGFFMFLMQITW
jgi:ATP-binding cassette subfamily B protein